MIRSINNNPNRAPDGPPPAVVTRPRDKRYSTQTKIGLSSRQGVEFMTILRLAILDACREGKLSRVMLAVDLGVPQKTLEKWLSPSETLAPRIDHVIRLLRADGPLPEKQRGFVLDWLAREHGRVEVDVLAADADEAPVGVQVAQIFAAGGGVAALVADMTAPDSDGGSELTAAEAAAILPLARVAVKEGTELVATLERIAGQQAGGLGQRLDVRA